MTRNGTLPQPANVSEWYFRRGWFVQISFQSSPDSAGALVWLFAVERLCKRGVGFTDGFQLTCTPDTFDFFRETINQIIDQDLAKPLG